ncbi:MULTISPECIES: hypothetical protein [unclassified Bosea (in: a-proteobacteria)]|uniref:hypothetical protein n=1 Tax=unclassified Bosea (in: a-proteobacteria) TaxID=2653178 RepID=UPI000F75CFB2|nr:MULTISPECIES: hypothetical protein [unclassified Bosea (in: a-proteobacteria)]AZO78566.1 hypothetical protein BLM15_13755 [Bosea sp. Tri-49]RXT17649.1 hypothetical protein B5U98_26675 [Bosea sp. Tri-39]RXT41022.1 hypothetical protein B5U99_04545 [Bosea sp. Tri-54]
MIRFRTIDPTQPEKPAVQPALVQAVAAVPAEPLPEDTSVAPATRKGLVRKAPLRAKATKTAPLFEK